MTLVVISPPPVLQFVDQNGKPLSGGLLFTYSGGTTTKTQTFTDSTGLTSNTNPIVLNSLGQAPSAIFIPPSANIKFVLAPSGSSDPPTSPIWTVDNVAGATTSAGTMALQDANNVDITGGSVTGVGTLTCTGATQLSTLTASGNVTLNGNQLTVVGTSSFTGAATFGGLVTINAPLNINASAFSIGSTVGSTAIEVQSLSSGFAATISLQTGNSTRWAIHKDFTSESGGNTGSNYNIDAYNDSGSLNFTALKINRATGLVTIGSLLINSNGGLTLSAQSNGAGASTATLTNSPSAGNPAFWLPVTIDGTQYFIPCMAA